jgi:glucosylceramidase
MTQVHDAFPRKNLYFTEQSVTGRSDDAINLSKPVASIIIGATRNWSRNVLLWNLAADPNNGPHTNDGGCTGCRGAVTIDGDKVTRLLAYFTLAHASKFVRPGSIRIESNTLESLPNAAFKGPDGKKVLMVANTSSATQKFDVRSGTNFFTTSLNAGSVGTYIW